MNNKIQLNKRNVTVVAETEADDEDLTQCDSPPSKEHARTSLGLGTKYKHSPEIFVQYTQDWEENNSVTVNIAGYTVPQKRKMVENCCQTTEKTTDDVEKLQAANKAFGAFIGLEMGFVPILKRCYVLDEIIKLIDRNSK